MPSIFLKIQNIQLIKMKTDMEVYGRTHDIKNNRYRSDSNEQRSPQTSKETREKHLLDKYNKYVQLSYK